jgi:hypothetical protein
MEGARREEPHYFSSMRTLRHIGLALGLALGALGAARAQGEAYLYLRTPDGASSLRVTEDSLLGPDIQVTRDGDSLRGRAYGEVVFLNLGEDELGGSVGERLSRLSFEREGNTLKARGTFGGDLTRLEISPEALSGTVGPCSYDLEASEAGYTGARSCGGPPERPVVLAVPPELANQGPAMTLAALALLMGG